MDDSRVLRPAHRNRPAVANTAFLARLVASVASAGRDAVRSAVHCPASCQATVLDFLSAAGALARPDVPLVHPARRPPGEQQKVAFPLVPLDVGRQEPSSAGRPTAADEAAHPQGALPQVR